MDRKGRWHGVTSISFLTQCCLTIWTYAGLWAGGIVTPIDHENQKCQFKTLSDVQSKRSCFLQTVKINASNMRILSTSSRPSPCWAIKGFTPFVTELMTQRCVIWMWTQIVKSTIVSMQMWTVLTLLSAGMGCTNVAPSKFGKETCLTAITAAHRITKSSPNRSWPN